MERIPDHPVIRRIERTGYPGDYEPVDSPEWWEDEDDE